jgi:heme O synthase-like polyprenyltransferase
MSFTTQNISVATAPRSWFAVYADLVKARLTLLVLLTTLVGFYAGWGGPMNYLAHVQCAAGHRAGGEWGGGVESIVGTRI